MSEIAKKVLGVIGILILGFAAYVAFYLPAGWRSVAVGMPRIEVTALLGKPNFDTGDIKGCFWFWGATPVRFELQVFFNSRQEIEIFSIRQYLGPSGGSYVRHIRFAQKQST